MAAQLGGGSDDGELLDFGHVSVEVAVAGECDVGLGGQRSTLT